MTDATQRLSAALAARYRIEHEPGAGGMAVVYLLSSTHHMMVVRVNAGATLAPSQPEVLFHVPDALVQLETTWYTPWDVAPDGRFIMARAVAGQGAPAGGYVVAETFLEELKARTGR